MAIVCSSGRIRQEGRIKPSDNKRVKGYLAVRAVKLHGRRHTGDGERDSLDSGEGVGRRV